MFAPDDSNITMGIHLIVNAIKKNKELVIDQNILMSFLSWCQKLLILGIPEKRSGCLKTNSTQ